MCFHFSFIWSCYNSQIETELLVVLCVCVCVRVLEATHWALLGSGTQESVLGRHPRRRACDWRPGGKLEWPCPAFCRPQSERIIRLPSADSPLPLLCFLKACGAQMDMCVGFEPHVTEQSCMLFLTHFCGKDTHSLVLETALSLMTNIC